MHVIAKSAGELWRVGSVGKAARLLVCMEISR